MNYRRKKERLWIVFIKKNIESSIEVTIDDDNIVFVSFFIHQKILIKNILFLLCFFSPIIQLDRIANHIDYDSF